MRGHWWGIDAPCPTPGSPDDVLRLAAYLRGVARDARFASGVLRAIGSDGHRWQGDAAAAFASLLAALPPRLDDLVRSYDGAERALTAYVEGPDGMRAAQTRALHAESRAQLARRDISVLRARSAEQVALRPSLPGLGSEAVWHREQHRVGAMLDDAVASLRSACAEAAAAGEAMAAAAHRAAARVDHAGHAGLHGPDIGLLQEVAEHAARIGGAVSAVTGVLALVTVPWCPPLAAALETVSLTTGAVALGCDAALRAAGESHKPWTQIGIDAAGLAAAGTGRVLLTGLRATRVQRLPKGTPHALDRAGRLVATAGRHAAGDRVVGVRQMRRLRHARGPESWQRALGTGEVTYRPLRRFTPPTPGEMVRATFADTWTMLRHPARWSQEHGALARGDWAYAEPLWDRYRLANGAGLVGQGMSAADVAAGPLGLDTRPVEDHLSRRVDNAVAHRPDLRDLRLGPVPPVVPVVGPPSPVPDR